MEKHAEIKPGETPDTEEKLEKQASQQGDPSVIKEQTKKLDDDATHRLADAASK